MRLGQNLFESLYPLIKTANAPSPATCVFISHKKENKAEAKAVAEALRGRGVDVYFDEYDKVLAQAQIDGDEVALVRCIEMGLSNCTHLLGIITPQSKDSWWVPYEIGGATGRRRVCAHLIDKHVSNLPAYIKVAPILVDQTALIEWVKGIERHQLLTLENIEKKAEAMDLLDPFLPQHRDPAELRFD